MAYDPTHDDPWPGLAPINAPVNVARFDRPISMDDRPTPPIDAYADDRTGAYEPMPDDARFPPSDAYADDRDIQAPAFVSAEVIPFAPGARQHSRPPARPFKFIPVADLKYRAPEYIIDELFETETMGLIFGDPGCGKSFLAVDIALSVATGAQFHGRKTRQGSVFFIAGEGHNGLARRFAAWSQARGVSLVGVPMFKSERAAQFLDGASAKSVADAVAALSAQHGSPALIIIDTLARNFGAGDENNTKDMSEFVAAIDELKARFPGCSVLIVHHSGHAEKQRARGAMALKGALDTEYRIEKEGSAMKLINTKMKDAEPPQDMFFSFIQVDLDGIAKSAVLEATGAPERKHRQTPTQRMAMATYEAAAVASGVWNEGAFRGVHVNDWRTTFYSKHTGDGNTAKRQAFHRVRTDLVNLGHLIATSDVYLTTDPGVQAAIMLLRDKRDMRDIA